MTVLGIGIYRPGAFSATLNGKYTKEYQVWKDMLRRCYCPKVQAKQPTYAGCRVSDSWKEFQIFAAWCQQQVGFLAEQYQLDKDLLVIGNQLYGPEFCVFLPKGLNSLFCDARAARGIHPIGVYLDGDKFKAQINRKGRRTNLGRFATAEDAHAAWVTAKQQDAQEWLGLIREGIVEVDGRVKDALQHLILNIESMK